MKVNVIKQHHKYPLGENEVDEGTGNYLIQTGVAEAINEKSEKPTHKEKKEIKRTREKRETKAGKVPTSTKKHI